ncbi:MAG: Flp family type IVb pilin [Clostridiales bacterium]|nr:Flp family type IVb pilin [Clostridiales bacterium]
MVRMLLNRLLKEEDGQGMVEYGLIIAGIALAVMAVIWAFGDEIKAMFESVSGDFSDRVDETTPVTPG